MKTDSVCRHKMHVLTNSKVSRGRAVPAPLNKAARNTNSLLLTILVSL